MRRWLATYVPVSVLCLFLGTLLITCGGGGDGGGVPDLPLTGLVINGPATVSEYGTGTYTATASWGDNTTSTVTPTSWSVNSQVATISASGVLTCGTIDADQTVTVTATYTYGGVNETDSMNVALTNIVTIPFTLQMLSDQGFFQESYVAYGSNYLSTLVILYADSSLEQFETDSTDGPGELLTGSWSLDASGNLIVDIGAQAPITVALISDSATEIQVLIDDGVLTPYIETLEKIVPIDPAKVPGTYNASPSGGTWVFNVDGTATVSKFPQYSLTWSVDAAGVLRIPANNGYMPVFYGRASSQSDNTSYTTLKVAFPEFAPTGDLYKYYGGMILQRP